MERTIGNNPEKGPHWCPTYQGLQRQLSALEQAAGTVVIPAPDQTWAPEVWEGRTGYWQTEDEVRQVVTPEILEAKGALLQHRTTCDPCVAHFSPQSAN